MHYEISFESARTMVRDPYGNTDISGPSLHFSPRLRSETRNSNSNWFRALVHSTCYIFEVNKQITNTITHLREQRNSTLRLTTRCSNSGAVTRRLWLPHFGAHWLASYDYGQQMRCAANAACVPRSLHRDHLGSTHAVGRDARGARV